MNSKTIHLKPLNIDLAASPGAPDQSFQFNDAGVFTGDPTVLFNDNGEGGIRFVQDGGGEVWIGNCMFWDNGSNGVGIQVTGADAAVTVNIGSCLFQDFDETFEPKDIDYEELEKLTTRIVKGWSTNLAVKRDWTETLKPDKGGLNGIPTTPR